jgi:hypothetical protein
MSVKFEIFEHRHDYPNRTEPNYGIRVIEMDGYAQNGCLDCNRLTLGSIPEPLHSLVDQIDHHPPGGQFHGAHFRFICFFDKAKAESFLRQFVILTT